MADPADIAVFAYGTLQLERVQTELFGRLLDGHADKLAGYRLEPFQITDPDVIATSGKAVHTIAVRSDDPTDTIDGHVYFLTRAEFETADAYEVDPDRSEVELASGQTAIIYIKPE
ncbi:gamma-glutamylcyclotransferase family protein [Hyphobacterium sp.]|uniref:gamma-glutamylcyclotransferase family protein n=1 Tax=Hyphobacterium sp. TaxID=2004662 RepID=UPI003BA8C09C